MNRTPLWCMYDIFLRLAHIFQFVVFTILVVLKQSLQIDRCVCGFVCFVFCFVFKVLCVFCSQG